MKKIPDLIVCFAFEINLELVVALLCSSRWANSKRNLACVNAWIHLTAAEPKQAKEDKGDEVQHNGIV